MLKPPESWAPRPILVPLPGSSMPEPGRALELEAQADAGVVDGIAVGEQRRGEEVGERRALRLKWRAFEDEEDVHPLVQRHLGDHREIEAHAGVAREEIGRAVDAR